MKNQNLICKACEKEFETERQLHSHLRAHSFRMVEYYQKFYPRYDLYDGKIIKFKNKKQYFNSDFNSRTNLSRWLKSKGDSEAQKYCSSLIQKRINEKEMEYTPSQVELKSLLIPPVQYYNELFGDYYKLCESLGLKNKYTIPQDIIEA